jgi:hypothetical protein
LVASLDEPEDVEPEPALPLEPAAPLLEPLPALAPLPDLSLELDELEDGEDGAGVAGVDGEVRLELDEPEPDMPDGDDGEEGEDDEVLPLPDVVRSAPRSQAAIRLAPSARETATARVWNFMCYLLELGCKETTQQASDRYPQPEGGRSHV